MSVDKLEEQKEDLLDQIEALEENVIRFLSVKKMTDVKNVKPTQKLKNFLLKWKKLKRKLTN